MNVRKVSEILGREDLLRNKPQDISEQDWLEELQSLYRERVKESLKAYGASISADPQARRKTREEELERSALRTARAFQAMKHGLLEGPMMGQVPLMETGSLDLLTKEKPEEIKHPGLPATYRASVPFERGRVSGELVSLSAGQEDALRAVLVLLEKYNYEGDRGADPTPSDWQDIFSGRLPKRSFSLSEYYEARGVTRDEEGRFRGQAAELAKKDLLDLGRSIEIGPYQFDLAGGGTRTIKATGPIMSIWLLEVTDTAPTGKWIRQEERVTVDPMPGLLRYIAQVEVTPHPILLSGLGIDDGQRLNFVRIETALRERIKDRYQGRRYPAAVEHLCSYLLTIDLDPFSIGKDLLAEKIGLKPLLDQGRRKRVSEYLAEAIQVALEVEILTSYEEAGDSYIFHLSPERGRRKAKLERQETLPAKTRKRRS